MGRLDEREAFAWMDGMKEDEEWLRRLETVETDDGERVSDRTLERIKEKTHRKIGAASFSKKRRSPRFRQVAVASLLLLAIGSALIGPKEVWGHIRSSLQWIPGLGIVLENKEEAIERYVLNEPVQRSVGSGTITVKGVIVDREKALVSLSGKGTKEITRVRFENGEGETFDADRYSIASGGKQFRGTFVYEGHIRDIDTLKIVLPEKEVTIPLSLQKAKHYESYEEMGPTDVVNGIGITAIPSFKGDALHVTLLSPPLEGMKMEAYGKLLISDEWQITLSDRNEKHFPLSAPDGYRSPLNEFTFDIGESDASRFILTIPFISKVADDTASITLDLPEQGSVEAGRTFDLAGYPVTIETVERRGRSVRVYVDTHFNPKASESLIGFRLNAAKLPGGGYSTRYNEETGEMEYMEFEAGDLSRIRLYVEHPQIIQQGPWVFPISR